MEMDGVVYEPPELGARTVAEEIAIARVWRGVLWAIAPRSGGMLELLTLDVEGQRRYRTVSGVTAASSATP